MSTSYPPFKFSHLFEAKFSQAAQYNILAGDFGSSPHVFARWQITYDGIAPAQAMIQSKMAIISRGRVTGGASNIQVGFYVTNDLITRNTFGLASTVSAVEVSLTGVQVPSVTIINPGRNYIEVAAGNGNGATTGFIRNFMCRAWWQLPINATIKRVL